MTSHSDLLLTTDMIPLCTKKPLRKSCFSFPFPKRRVYLPSGCYHMSSLSFCIPIKSNLYFCCFATVISEPALHKVLNFMYKYLVNFKELKSIVQIISPYK
jgi:hypothetical protein